MKKKYIILCLVMFILFVGYLCLKDPYNNYQSCKEQISEYNKTNNREIICCINYIKLSIGDTFDFKSCKIDRGIGR